MVEAQLRHKTEIPPAALILIGAIVTTASIIINVMTDSLRFTLFILAGLGIFGYGVIETFSQKPKTPRRVQNNPHHRPRQYGAHHAAHAAGQHAKRLVSGQRATPYHFCPFCGTRVPRHASYCQGCGQHLTH